MKILAIETATPASSVALGGRDHVAAMAFHVNRRGHVGFLVPALQFCFDQAGWRPEELDVVAVDIGPGPFSGIRAGVATAQAVAAGIGAPIVTVDSLTALALRAATGRRHIWPIIDARRSQVATAPFRPVPGGVVRDGPTEIVSPDGFRGLIDADPVDILVVGEWQALPEKSFRGLHRVKTGRPRYPSADILLEIAALRADRDEFAGPEDVRPLYLREPDAKINWTEFREEGLWPGATPPSTS